MPKPTKEKRPKASEIKAQKLPYPARQSDMKKQPEAIFRITNRRAS
ncbi:MAG: hypothetical protein M3Z64_08495 [Verrucomicrobiota bacterium]|nr:hypothetical protein [Verrucomicrobiota bacterium]